MNQPSDRSIDHARETEAFDDSVRSYAHHAWVVQTIPDSDLSDPNYFSVSTVDMMMDGTDEFRIII